MANNSTVQQNILQEEKEPNKVDGQTMDPDQSSEHPAEPADPSTRATSHEPADSDSTPVIANTHQNKQVPNNNDKNTNNPVVPVTNATSCPITSPEQCEGNYTPAKANTCQKKAITLQR